MCIWVLLKPYVGQHDNLRPELSGNPEVHIICAWPKGCCVFVCAQVRVCVSEFGSPQPDILRKTWGHCKRSKRDCSGLSAAFSSVFLILIWPLHGTMSECEFWHNGQMHVGPEMEDYKQLFQSISALQPARLGYIELLQEEVKRTQDVSDLLSIQEVSWNWCFVCVWMGFLLLLLLFYAILQHVCGSYKNDLRGVCEKVREREQNRIPSDAGDHIAILIHWFFLHSSG